MNIVVPILIMFVIGVVAGLLASKSNLMRRKGVGLEGSIIIGIFGSFIGGVANISGITKSVLGIKIGGPLGYADMDNNRRSYSTFYHWPTQKRPGSLLAGI